jgi:hypothetical protein
VARSQRSVDAYAAQISEILDKAAAADARTRAALEANSVAEYADLPSELDYTEQMDAVDQAAFPTLTSQSQARIWQYAHPMEKDRVIAEQPEVYGAAAGLPSEDRDKANRILLAREKSALLDQQADATKYQQLDAVNSRLRAIDKLEGRLADPSGPKVYLVDYRPGDEANSTLIPEAKQLPRSP